MPNLLDAHLALRFRHADRPQRVGQLGARQADQRRLGWRHVALERRLLDEGRRDLRHFDCCHRSSRRVRRQYRTGVAYLRSEGSLSRASATPLSEYVSVVLVPRPDSLLTTRSAPFFMASTICASSAAFLT